MTDGDRSAEPRRSAGRALRKEVPRSSHGDWSPAPDRPDPVELITSQNESRLQFLVPIRHWRMAQSPFAFYRGGAKVMAGDLSTTPVTGLRVQLCGDAHLSNFGVFGSPERSLVFDVNDFDETLPGPWEWDVKRLAASFSIAARHNGYGDDDELDLPRRVVRAYREAMLRFAEASYSDVWYAHLDVEEVYRAFADRLTKKERKRGTKFVTKARSKNSLHAFDKLAEHSDDGYRIASQPPLIVPLREVPHEQDPEALSSVYVEHGRRVVEGQRLMQAASDSFLGWTAGPDGTHYYVRQFKDMKGSVEVDGAPVHSLQRYAALCGWTLARAHARSGEPAAIAGYLGKSDNFDRAIAEFSVAYVDQNQSDYEAFTAAIAQGRLAARE